MTNSSGILVAIDFEKAYDSVTHDFLFKVSEKFNFGSYFMQWIRTFYTDMSRFQYKFSFVQIVGFVVISRTFVFYLGPENSRVSS